MGGCVLACAIRAACCFLILCTKQQLVMQKHTSTKPIAAGAMTYLYVCRSLLRVAICGPDEAAGRPLQRVTSAHPEGNARIRPERVTGKALERHARLPAPYGCSNHARDACS